MEEQPYLQCNQVFFLAKCRFGKKYRTTNEKEAGDDATVVATYGLASLICANMEEVNYVEAKKFDIRRAKNDLS